MREAEDVMEMSSQYGRKLAPWGDPEQDPGEEDLDPDDEEAIDDEEGWAMHASDDKLSPQNVAAFWAEVDAQGASW